MGKSLHTIQLVSLYYDLSPLPYYLPEMVRYLYCICPIQCPI